MFFAGDAQLCGQLTKFVLVKIKALLPNGKPIDSPVGAGYSINKFMQKVVSNSGNDDYHR